MGRIKLKRSSHGTSPARGRVDEPTEVEGASNSKREDQYFKEKSSAHSSKYGHPATSEDRGRTEETKSKSESSKSKKSRHSRSSRSPKDGEKERHKSKKSKTKSPRRDRSNSGDDTPVKSKKSRVTSPRGRSPRLSSPEGMSKGVLKDSTQEMSPEPEGTLEREKEETPSCSRRLKGMSSATMETMFRDFLTSKMSEIEKLGDDEEVGSDNEDGDEKFADIKEAIKDGTISNYINQKMQLIDMEFQRNLARIKEESDDESGEVVTPVEESAESEEVQPEDPAAEESEVERNDIPEAEPEVKVESDVLESKKESPKKDSKKDSKSKKHKHKDKDKDKEKSKDHKKHKEKHKDKNSKSKKSSRHGSGERSHSRQGSRDPARPVRSEKRSDYVDLRDKLRGGGSFGYYGRSRSWSRSPSWSSLDSRSRSRSLERGSRSKDTRGRSRDWPSQSRDRRSRSRERRSRSKERKSRSKDHKSKKKGHHDRDGKDEKRAGSKDNEKSGSGEDEAEPDTFIERKELTVKKTVHDDDDDDDFLLKKLGALKKKVANQGEGEAVKVAASSVIIGGMKKSGLVRTIKNESGAADASVDDEKSGTENSNEGAGDAVPTVKSEVGEMKDSKADDKVDVKKGEQAAASSGADAASEKTSEDKTEKKKSFTFVGLKKSTGDDGGNVASQVEKVDDGAKEKKGLPKLGIKISKTSSELISSGLTFDNKRNRIIEEGEVLDSDDEEKSNKGESSSFSDSLDTDSSDGEIKSESEAGKEGKKKKKEKKKKKDKKKKHKKSKDKEKEKSSSKRKSAHRSRSRSPKRFRRDANGIWSTRERFRRSYSRSPDRHYDDDRRGGRDYRNYSYRQPYMDRFASRKPRPFRYYHDRYRHSRSRSRSRSKSPGIEIDKERLREIAITKALAAMKSGQGPALNLNAHELARVRAGGKSVDELTDFCKKMAKKEGDGSSDESPTQFPHDSDEEGPFMHHPFKVRDSGPIMMNIKNAKQLPILSASEKAAQSGPLRIQYPVSSGSQHRAKESEWVPVEKTTAAASTTTTTTVAVVQKTVTTNTTTPSTTPSSGTMTTAAGAASAIAAASTATTTTAANPDTVFKEPPAEVKNLNISALVSERLTAMKKLSANPNDVEAMGTIFKANQKVQAWAESKHLPGQFSGSTGANIMTQQELAGAKHLQAWAKKDQFDRAEPVKGGIGMFLLQKMGWKQGEGLGKNNEGTLEPLNMEIKLDRKGLTSNTEQPQRKVPVVPRAPIRDLSGKHPVSALTELCNKKKWGSPEFILVHESGPDHKKNFLFKVKVNRVEYQPSIASSNKKQAKAQCASVCLQALGLLPKDFKLQSM